MQPQTRTPARAKSRKRAVTDRPASASLRRIAAEVPIPDADDADGADYADIRDDPAYIRADRVHHLEPGSATEEDTEHAEAEITELLKHSDAS
jgi:hypothetical protein